MGDNFQINVIDDMTNATMLKTTSIHWHGFFQHGTNWADGPAFVNQCPIASGDSFLYNFEAPGQVARSGTTAISYSVLRWLRGPMVVYDPSDPYADLYDVDDDSTVITLSDCTTSQPGWVRIPVRGADSTLINGLGRAVGGNTTDLTVITVEQGKRYRFRLVSMSCDPNYTFSIDGHNMTVIEVDAVNHEPLVVDSIQIFAGQRYSFVLTADQTVDNYWIRADPSFGNTGFVNGINSAILQYSGAANGTDPTSTQTTSIAPLVETNLVPLENAAAPGEAVAGGVDYALNLVFNFNGSNFFINDAVFVPPTVPILLQILSGAQTAQDLLPTGSVYTLPANSTIEISMPATANAPGAPHPFHLHGHTFSVVRSAGSDTYNYVNPVQRDVVSTGTPGDNVTIRFTTDNPGPWFLHCHIDFHLEAGFAIVFAEDAADVATATLSLIRGPISAPSTMPWTRPITKLCPDLNSLRSF
ncbi:Laccase-4 [Grifola frondosa]|uniref:laccase n=1 Tax=Grifola frondosa TaxID=5627 RepID=A0A1C7M4Y9_GRIFR|nr:Laccase-4 [Grifola frondosa]